MLLRMAVAAIRHSRRRLTIAFLALALSGLGLCAGGAMVLDLGPRLGQALSGLGPDVMFLGSTSASILPRLSAALPGTPLAPVRVAALECRGPVVAVGTAPAAYLRLHSYMQVTGVWPSTPSQAAAGIDLARRLTLKPGAVLALSGPRGRADVTVTALVETGGEEDARLVVDTAILARIASPAAQESVEARLAGDEAAVAVAAGRAAHDAGARFELIRATALAQGLAYRRAGAIVPPVMVLVVLTAGLTVFATWTSLLLARRKEIALLRALGSSARELVALLGLEALLVALAAGLAGAVLGLPVARLLGQWVFSLPTTANPRAIAVATLMVIGVTWLAVVGPIRQALGADVAAILRGE